MFTNPSIGQLARDHHREMIAEARQRQLSHQAGRSGSRIPRAPSALRRGLTAVMAKVTAAFSAPAGLPSE
ncbi:MAG TPA: hypothetical protein VMA97_01940 [Streptosporangiaceae bacterium]|nr:hypothetical protein [Streptosporangiaceae bacterium]